MLKIKENTTNAESKRCTPNLLPCHVHRNASVDASSRYWAPEVTKDGAFEAYFRGRKLRGREVKLPKDYEGVIVENAGIEQPSLDRDRMTDDPEDEEVEEIKVLKETGKFETVVLWGHGAVVEDDDAFVKGLNEWVGFADAV